MVEITEHNPYEYNNRSVLLRFNGCLVFKTQRFDIDKDMFLITKYIEDGYSINVSLKHWFVDLKDPSIEEKVYNYLEECRGMALKEMLGI